MSTSSLPSFLADLLESCPAAGDGVHFWIFKVARHLLVHFDERSTFELIKEKALHSGRPLSKLECEIASQIRNALPRRWQPKHPERFSGGASLRSESPLPVIPPAWPTADPDLIANIVESGILLADLAERSPVVFDSPSPRTEQIVDILFPGNPLLCVGKSKYRFAIRRREVWRGHLSRLPLIVPNPMLKPCGLTLEGKESEHCLDATADRVYLAVEFDFSLFGRDGQTLSCWAPLVREWQAQGKTVADACAALHSHLARRLPLACVTHSGGKSLHGWYRALDRSESELRTFVNYAVSLGADSAWTRSQFVRIPDGLRENGKRQTCYYLDPQNAVTL